MKDYEELGFKKIKGNKPSLLERIKSKSKSIAGSAYKSAKRSILNEPMDKEDYERKLTKLRQDRKLLSEQSKIARIQSQKAKIDAQKSREFRSSLFGGSDSYSSYDVMTGINRTTVKKRRKK